MSTLVSWIDVEAVASIARELCPEEEIHGRPRGNSPVLDPVEFDWDPALGRLPRGMRPLVAENPSEEEFLRARERLEWLHRQMLSEGPEGGQASLSPGGPPPPSEKREPAAAGRASSPSGPRPPRLKAGRGSGQFPPSLEEGVSGPTFSPFEVPAGTMGVRLSAFVKWASQICGGADIFVIDAQGYPLAERGGDPDLMAAALLLGDASQRVAGRVRAEDRNGSRGRSPGGVLRMELGSGKVLSVLTADTIYGGLCLGVHHTDAVSAELAPRLVHALFAALGA